ncbi:MAG: dTMP kinase [Gammaproteobacteria bacterium]|nr:dTMP kinase [Gammaproteobacteria bacterium]
MKEARFISLEGIEGSGKTTSLQTINKILDKQSIEHINTREPGGSSIGNELRELLLNKKTTISSEVELLLMLADRKDHVDKVIKPNLNKGTWVVTDRFMDSTMAYQGGGRGLEISKIELIAGALELPVPALTLLFDLPVNLAFQRIADRENLDRFESEPIDFHNKIREAYLRLAEKNKDRIVIIDSSKSLKEVSAQVKKAINQIL